MEATQKVHKGERSGFVAMERELTIKVRRYVKGVSDLDIEEQAATLFEDAGPNMADHGWQFVEVMGVRDVL